MGLSSFTFFSFALSFLIQQAHTLRYPEILYYKLLGKGTLLHVIYIIALSSGIMGPQFIFAN